MHRRGERRHRAGAREIGVVEDEERRLAAEFEEDLLECRRAVGHHSAARRRRAGERNHVHPWVFRQQRADAVVAGGDDVDHARRNVGVLGDELPHRGSAPRGVGCRLQDDGVACGQCGPDLGEVDLMREVPRGDRADHADRLPGDRPVGLDAHRRGDACVGGPLVGLRRVGAEAEVGDRALQLRGRRQHHRRAHLRDRDLAQILDVLGQHLLQLPNAAHPQFGVGGPVGFVECAAGRLDRAAHIVGARVGGDAQHLLGGRVDRRERAGATGHEFPVDEQLTLAIGQHPHTDSRLLLDNCPTTFTRTIAPDRREKQGWAAQPRISRNRNAAYTAVFRHVLASRGLRPITWTCVQ